MEWAWFISRVKRALRAFLDVESLEDATVRRKHLHGRVDMISQNVAELLSIVERQGAEGVQVHRYFTMTILAWELERDHIEAGLLPCGCMSEQEHRNGGGRGHTEILMRRVDRWLDYKKREANR